MSKESLNSLIENLDEINKQNTASILVPSAGTEMKFSLFNVSQYKELLKSAFEGYNGVINSGIIFNNIIKDNCLEDHEFLLTDKSYILTQLRKESVGDKYTYNDKEYTLSSLPEPDFDFTYESDIEYNGVCVHMSIPTLHRDTIVSKKLITELNKLTESQKETDAVNLVLTHEIVKFVNWVEIGDTKFEFDDFNLYDSKKVVDSLPLKLNNMIIEAISEFKKVEEKNITFDDDTLLEIDASFLSVD